MRRSPDQPPAHSAAWIPYVVLLVSLGATVIATAHISRTSLARDSLRFKSAVVEAENNITAHLDVYNNYLRAGGSFDFRTHESDVAYVSVVSLAQLE